MGIEELRELMSSLDTLPGDSPAVQAGKAFVDAVLADVRAKGHVGTKLLEALNAARDPKDAVYARLGVMERAMAVAVVNTLAKSMEG